MKALTVYYCTNGHVSDLHGAKQVFSRSNLTRDAYQISLMSLLPIHTSYYSQYALFGDARGNCQCSDLRFWEDLRFDVILAGKTGVFFLRLKEGEPRGMIVGNVGVRTYYPGASTDEPMGQDRRPGTPQTDLDAERLHRGPSKNYQHLTFLNLTIKGYEY